MPSFKPPASHPSIVWMIGELEFGDYLEFGAWCFIGNFEVGTYLILGASLFCGKRRMKKVVIRGRSEDGYEGKASFCPEGAEESPLPEKRGDQRLNRCRRGSRTAPTPA
jgi:hypothetical protein